MRTKSILPLLLIIIGAALVLDELWLFGIPFGGFLGDWSALHIIGFHHWMLGVVLLVIGFYLLFVRRTDNE